MILDKNEILLEVNRGALVISPFEKGNVGECSVDLRLGNEFRVFKKQAKQVVVSEEPYLWEKQTKLKILKKNEKMILNPGELVLGITLEKIVMPQYLCGWIQGRSRFARMGLLVHVSSSLIQPGVNNKQVLEIVNLSPNKIVLVPGLKICQVVFQQLTGPQKHSGIFSKQDKI